MSIYPVFVILSGKGPSLSIVRTSCMPVARHGLLGCDNSTLRACTVRSLTYRSGWWPASW